ncbi:MAG: PASTA domain-containing protein [Spirochaetaceae bacterium]|jgi:beta-lactam-binding protein with PASTA domain|nr:PASTA domain-containing protein [Spirochaetaceae bacterium]
MDLSRIFKRKDGSYRVSSFSFFCISLVLLMFIAALAAFFFDVNGAEQTMVPDVRGTELPNALLELQVKELYPRIQLVYSNTEADKGTILSQDPQPGTIVKAGRRIRLVVSQGVVINTVGNYIGRQAEDVRMDIRTLFVPGSTGSKALLTVQEPFIYEYAPEDPGTVIQQDPAPGTALSGPAVLSLVVSLGPEFTEVITPNLVGLDPKAAADKLIQADLGFEFAIRQPREGEQANIVVYQEPSANSPTETGAHIYVLSNSPGLFEYTLPENPYPLTLSLEALPPNAGERTLLVECRFSGGNFTFPYSEAEGTTLILSQMGREIYREVVTGSQ